MQSVATASAHTDTVPRRVQKMVRGVVGALAPFQHGFIMTLLPKRRAAAGSQSIPSWWLRFRSWRSRLALRAASRARSAGGDVKRSERVFRLNGLRWHHMAIARDLRRFAAHVSAFDCSSASSESLCELQQIFSFFHDNIWKTYNTLERDVLFPWLCEGGKNASGYADVKRAIDAFSHERDRIDVGAEGLRQRLAALSRKGRSQITAVRIPRVCTAEVRRIVSDVDILLADAARLHKAEQETLFPYIARQFTKDDQSRLTFKIVNMMDKTLAKLNLVSFHEALKTTSATRADWKNYEREVPTPVRLYLWVWKGRLWDPSPLARLDSSVTNTKQYSTRRNSAANGSVGVGELAQQER